MAVSAEPNADAALEAPPRSVSEIQETAHRNCAGCRLRSKEHGISHQRWSFVARALAMTSAIVAGIGGLGAIGSASAGSNLAVIGGVMVVVGVLARAIDEGLGATKTAERHRLAALRFRELEMQWGLLWLHPPSDPDKAIHLFEDIQAREVRADAESPLVENWARKKRLRDLRKGKKEAARREAEEAREKEAAAAT